tara:strand:- start:2665 stop:2871 length:207 start_codon:yes stop_codon:yes gene_type:complete
MSETHQHCPNCLEEGNLLKIPSVASIFTKSEHNPSPRKTGDLVKEFIEESRAEVEEEKRILRSEEYKS